MIGSRVAVEPAGKGSASYWAICSAVQQHCQERVAGLWLPAWVGITPTGRRALNRHIKTLRALIDALERPPS